MSAALGSHHHLAGGAQIRFQESLPASRIKRRWELVSQAARTLSELPLPGSLRPMSGEGTVLSLPKSAVKSRPRDVFCLSKSMIHGLEHCPRLRKCSCS